MQNSNRNQHQNHNSTPMAANIKSENNVTNIEIKFANGSNSQKAYSTNRNTNAAPCSNSITSGFSDAIFHTTTSSILSEDRFGTSGCDFLDDDTNKTQSDFKTANRIGCLKKSKILLTALSTISLSVAFNNTVRLQKEIYIQNRGINFLVAFYILSILVGFPLVFLEFGIGQLIQSNCFDVWKAVPLFKGLGVLKVFLTVIMAINLPVQIGLSLYYFLWTAMFGIPFPQCLNMSTEIMNNSTNISSISSISSSGLSYAELCLQNTFLLFPAKNQNPYYFGTFIAILFVLWLVICICVIKKDISYKLTTSFCFVFVLISFATLFTLNGHLTMPIISLVNWRSFLRPEIWFFAMIQVLLGSHLSLGHLETTFGYAFNKNNFFWSATFYQLFNLIFATVSYLAVDLLLQNKTHERLTDILLQLWIYNSAIFLPKQYAIIFACCYYLLVAVAGLCSMITIVYVLGRVINLKIKNWILVINLISISGFVLSSCTLLLPNLKLLHIFDDLIVNHIVYVITVFQLVALIGFYGCKNVYSDFEFILGQKISKFWKFIWKVDLLILLGIYVWKTVLLQISLQNLISNLVEIAVIFFVLVFAFGQISVQNDYNFLDKLKSSLKPDRKWGPVDPIRRRDWLQWREKLDVTDGRRDFTLKRRATRDYTNSIMKNSRRLNQQRDRSALSQSRSRSQSQRSRRSVLQSTPISLIDTAHLNRFRTPLQPPLPPPMPDQFKLTAIIDSYDKSTNDFIDSTNGSASGSVQTSSEGYGSIRNGPYKNIIEL